MEYVRVNLMLFQQDLNTACVQGLLLLSLQSPKWEPSPSPWCWIRREWKNPSSQLETKYPPTCSGRENSSRTSAPHLRSMTIIFMLMCKIFQGLEPPHPCLLAGHQGERRGCSFSLGAPQVTNSRLQRQGIVIQVSRIARTSITTGQKRRRFSLIILPKSCSNSRPKQLSQGISEHTGSEFLPFSVWSQVLKICKSVYYWR